jgi:DNA-binding MarR family transcriptional regulator
MRDVRIRETLSNEVGKLFRHVARMHNRALRPFGISAVQGNILAILWSDGPMTIGALQAELALGSSTLTGAIDRMEKAGLLRRVAVEGDRRAVRLEPVAWPAKRRQALAEAVAATEEACYADLSTAERQALARLLRKAVASIEKVDRGDDD